MKVFDLFDCTKSAATCILLRHRIKHSIHYKSKIHAPPKNHARKNAKNYRPRFNSQRIVRARIHHRSRGGRLVFVVSANRFFFYLPSVV